MSEGMKFVEIGTDDPNVIGIQVGGKISAEDMAQLTERLENIHSTGGKAKCYINLVDYDGADLGVIKEKLTHIGTYITGFDRLAYVVDKAWMSKAIGLIDAVTPMHMRAFGSDQDAEARAWLLSDE